MNIQPIKNVSDCVPLYLPHSLYLKPCAKFNVSVQLPAAITGKTISNWDVMENLKKIIAPDKFSVLKVSICCSHMLKAQTHIELIPMFVLSKAGDKKYVGRGTIRC